VSRARRSAISAFTRVFNALWRCAAEPGPSLLSIGIETAGDEPAVLHFALEILRSTKRRITLALPKEREMAKPAKHTNPIVLKAGMSIGSVSAETDDDFLFDCFVRHAAVEESLNPKVTRNDSRGANRFRKNCDY